MSAPPSNASNGARRGRPRGPRKPKAPSTGAPASTPSTPSSSLPPHLAHTAASTPSLASTVTTPSMTPRAATPAPGKTFSDVKFEDFLVKGDISQATMAGINAGGYVSCTQVQAETLPVILTGLDVLAQAKTGTGKTLGFLVPSIERLLRSPQQPAARGQISVLVLSPTRELAIQIEDSARTLLTGTPYKVQHVVGGTNMSAETKRLNNERCDFLIATPGRLLDHLENSTLKPKLAQLKSFILDEADRLLEAGFRRELEKIISYLPARQTVPRQTLLFSATIPQQVHQLSSLALLPNHRFISTIPPDEENTHEHVEQFVLTPPSLFDLFPTTLAVLRAELAQHGGALKAMVFLPTARATGLVAQLMKRTSGFREQGVDFYEIHSRKSQSQRNAAAEAFKNAKGGIMLSSDVTARGMDFPNVTTVLQVGLPASPEQYIHRLGRTARAGSSTASGGGRGILILAPFETFFLRKPPVRNLPLQPHPLAGSSLNPQGPELAAAREELKRACGAIGEEEKGQFYSASLGFYKAVLRDAFNGNAALMVQTFNEFATSPDGLGCAQVPGLLAQTVGKMNLRGTPGLNIVKELPGKEGRGGNGGGRGGGRGGQGGGRGGGGGGGGGGRGGGGGGRGGGGGGRGRGAGAGRGGRGRGAGGP
ncbi:hypothetical protein JCM11251_003619 [Rhodosporidiobolus azoricus]